MFYQSRRILYWWHHCKSLIQSELDCRLLPTLPSKFGEKTPYWKEVVTVINVTWSQLNGVISCIQITFNLIGVFYQSCCLNLMTIAFHVTLTHWRHQLLLKQLLYMYLLSKSGGRRSYECRDVNFYHCFHCFVIKFSQIFKSRNVTYMYYSKNIISKIL